MNLAKLSGKLTGILLLGLASAQNGLASNGQDYAKNNIPFYNNSSFKADLTCSYSNNGPTLESLLRGIVPGSNIVKMLEPLEVSIDDNFIRPEMDCIFNNQQKSSATMYDKVRSAIHRANEALQVCNGNSSTVLSGSGSGSTCPGVRRLLVLISYCSSAIPFVDPYGGGGGGSQSSDSASTLSNYFYTQVPSLLRQYSRLYGRVMKENKTGIYHYHVSKNGGSSMCQLAGGPEGETDKSASKGQASKAKKSGKGGSRRRLARRGRGYGAFSGSAYALEGANTGDFVGKKRPRDVPFPLFSSYRCRATAIDHILNCNLLGERQRWAGRGDLWGSVYTDSNNGLDAAQGEAQALAQGAGEGQEPFFAYSSSARYRSRYRYAYTPTLNTTSKRFIVGRAGSDGSTEIARYALPMAFMVKGDALTTYANLEHMFTDEDPWGELEEEEQRFIHRDSNNDHALMEVLRARSMTNGTNARGGAGFLSGWGREEYCPYILRDVRYGHTDGALYTRRKRQKKGQEQQQQVGYAHAEPLNFVASEWRLPGGNRDKDKDSSASSSSSPSRGSSPSRCPFTCADYGLYYTTILRDPVMRSISFANMAKYKWDNKGANSFLKTLEFGLDNLQIRTSEGKGGTGIGTGNVVISLGSAAAAALAIGSGSGSESGSGPGSLPLSGVYQDKRAKKKALKSAALTHAFFASLFPKQIDNYHVRTFGGKSSWQRPFGGVGFEDDLLPAARVLNTFDLVLTMPMLRDLPSSNTRNRVETTATATTLTTASKKGSKKNSSSRSSSRSNNKGGVAGRDSSQGQRTMLHMALGWTNTRAMVQVQVQANKGGGRRRLGAGSGTKLGLGAGLGVGLHRSLTTDPFQSNGLGLKPKLYAKKNKKTSKLNKTSAGTSSPPPYATSSSSPPPPPPPGRSYPKTNVKVSNLRATADRLFPGESLEWLEHSDGNTDGNSDGDERSGASASASSSSSSISILKDQRMLWYKMLNYTNKLDKKLYKHGAILATLDYHFFTRPLPTYSLKLAMARSSGRKDPESCFFFDYAYFGLGYLPPPPNPSWNGTSDALQCGYIQ